MACASCVLASRRDWGLADRGRSRSAARITYHAHGLRTGRAMRRERRAADAPCGSLVFLKRPRRGPAAGQPVLLCGEPLFVGRMLGRDRGVSCRDGTLHLLLRRSLWHRGPELPPQNHSLVGRSRTPGLGNINVRYGITRPPPPPAPPQPYRRLRRSRGIWDGDIIRRVEILETIERRTPDLR